MDLTREEVLLLIEEYRKQRNLWDSNYEGFYDKNKKRQSWEKIGETLHINAEDAKRKILSLLSSLRREKAKTKKNGPKKDYKSDWYAFDSFAFLWVKDDENETINSGQTDVEIIECLADTDSVENIFCCSEKSDESSSEGEEKKGSFLDPSMSIKKRKLSSDHQEVENDIQTENAFKLLVQPIKRKNSTEMYSKYLAEKLNQFDQKTKAILIHKINQLIFNAEMNKYSYKSETDVT